MDGDYTSFFTLDLNFWLLYNHRCKVLKSVLQQLMLNQMKSSRVVFYTSFWKHFGRPSGAECASNTRSSADMLGKIPQTKWNPLLLLYSFSVCVCAIEGCIMTPPEPCPISSWPLATANLSIHLLFLSSPSLRVPFFLLSGGRLRRFMTLPDWSLRSIFWGGVHLPLFTSSARYSSPCPCQRRDCVCHVPTKPDELRWSDWCVLPRYLFMAISWSLLDWYDLFKWWLW